MNANRPNILFLFSDQHSAFTKTLDVGSAPRTPNLDKLAEAGAVFPNAYCNSPICVPSRMSLLSARLPSQVGAFQNDDRLSTLDPTIAHGLRSVGYDTILCGKMHFLPPDMHQGFESVILGEPEEELFDEIRLRHPETAGWQATGRAPLVFSGPGRQGFGWFDEEVAARCSGFLASRTENERPFFLTAGFVLPHNPYVCDAARFEYHYRHIDPERLARRIASTNAHSDYLSVFRKVNKLENCPLEAHHRALAAYFGLCEQLDCNIGRILDTLARSPFARNTIVAYSSDHGEICARHGLWYKSAATEDSMRVPLVIQGPGIPAGCRRRVVSLLDLAVTFCSLAGAAPPPSADGRSFADCLYDPVADDPGAMICESSGRAGAGPLWTMRKGSLKYTYCHEPQLEILCDLERDPGEDENLIGMPEHADTITCFRQHRSSYWNADALNRAWEARREARAYIERVQHPIRTAPPPPPVRCPPGTNQFDIGCVPTLVRDFLP